MSGRNSLHPIICSFSFVAIAHFDTAVAAAVSLAVAINAQFVHLGLKLLTFILKFLSLLIALFLKC